MASLVLESVTVVKGSATLIADVNLNVADGELLAIVGPSGCGKTTLLRSVAGLDELDAGVIIIDGVEQPQGIRSDVAMLFQENVLFPNMDVEENVSFPLEVRHLPKSEVRERVTAEVRALHIEELLKRNPRHLSAGHQQMVQIARALVRVPQVFLMDEPLARLDTKLKIVMRGELRMLQRGYGVTTLYVTNDPVEAMSVADRVAVMQDGAVVQVDTPEVVYHEPRNTTVAALLGDVALLEVKVEHDGAGSWLVHPGFRLRAWAPVLADHEGRTLLLGLRPEYVEPAPSPDVVASVIRIEHLGASQLAWADVGGDRVPIRLNRPHVGKGELLGIRFGRYMLFDAASGESISS